MRRSLNPRQMYAGIAIGAVVAVVTAALMVVGPPQVARRQQLDEQRVRDLMTITHAVDQFHTRHARLPASLDELASEPQSVVKTKDPEGRESYVYRVSGDRTYEVCATFSLGATAADNDAINRFWSHDAGRKCFSLEARDSSGAGRR